MDALKVSYELDRLKDIADERRRVILVLHTQPSKGDTIALKKQLNKTLDLLSNGGVDSGYFDLYNELLEDICEYDTSIDKTLYECKYIKAEHPANHENVSPSKKVRFKDEEQLVSYKDDESNEQVQEFPRYKDEVEELASSSSSSSLNMITNQELFIQQQQQMLEQDSHLDLLSQSLHKSHDISIDINREVAEQNDQVLQDLESLLDSSSTKLERAKRRLSIFEKTAKENGPILIIVLLIFILFFLIVVL